MGYGKELVCHLLQESPFSYEPMLPAGGREEADWKICSVNGCNLQHNYLLHPDQGKASVNMFTVLEEDNVDEEEPASEDEEEDDQSPRARLMRGILQDGRPMREKPGIR